MNPIAGVKKYKPLLLFVAKVLGIFLLFLLLKYIHKLLIDPSCTLPLAVWLRDFNIYVVLADAILYPCQWILHSLGYQTLMAERTISIAGYRGIIIHAPCLGINIIAGFAALIIAYPSKAGYLKKISVIFLGIMGIYLLNIIRVTGLTLRNRYSLVLPVDHHDLFNIIIYSFVFLIFYWWIKSNSRTATQVKPV